MCIVYIRMVRRSEAKKANFKKCREKNYRKTRDFASNIVALCYALHRSLETQRFLVTKTDPQTVGALIMRIPKNILYPLS